MSETNWRHRLALFEIADFRNLSAARVLWSFAQQIFNVGMSLLVYDRTGSALALGSIGLASFLPGLLLTLVSGPVADRFDRRRIACVCFALGLLAAAGSWAADKAFGVAWLYGMVVLLGAARAFASPALTALLPNVAPKERLAQAFAINNSLGQIASITGPMFGGFLYEWSAGAPFVSSFCLFAAAMIAIVAVKPRPPLPGRRADFQSLIAGYRYIWNRPVILGAVSLDLIAVILGGATALLPIYAIDIFHAGPAAVGILRGANSIGALAAAMVMTLYPLGGRTGRTMFICVAMFGLATIGFGYSTTIVWAIFFLAALGAADQVSVVIRQMLVQLQTPDEMRGRVTAAFSIITDASNQIGQFESGLVAGLVGVVGSVVLGGVGSVLAAALWIKWFPSLWAYDRLE